MDMPTLPGDFKPKTFWSRPEGKMGLAVMGVIALVGVYSLDVFLPVLTRVLSQLIVATSQSIVLIGLVGVLAIVIGAVFGIGPFKKLNILLGFMFKSLMRKITGWFIEIDPIGIMRNYIDVLCKKQATMDGAIEKLAGQLRYCKNLITQNQAKHDESMAMVAVAQKKGMTGALAVNSRQAGRMEKINNTTLIPMQRTMEMTLTALRKYREVTDVVIQDMTNEVNAKSLERKMLLAAWSVTKSAQAILQGDPDKRELFDQAMEYTVEDYGQKMGEIENFIQTSKSFVDTLDLQNGVYEADALVKLQQWEANADSILLGDSKRLLIEQQVNTSPIVTDIGRAPVTIEGDFQKFLK